MASYHLIHTCTSGFPHIGQTHTHTYMEILALCVCGRQDNHGNTVHLVECKST